MVFQSKTTPAFRKQLRELPPETQTLAGRCYLTFKKNPWDPSLDFSKLQGLGQDSVVWRAKVGGSYRVIGKLLGSSILWFWIGSHEEYNGIVKSKGMKKNAKRTP